MANLVNHSLSIDVGLPSTLPFKTWILSAACNGTSPFQIPVELQHYLKIQEACYNAFTLLPTPLVPDNIIVYSSSLATALPQSEQELDDLTQTSMSLFNRMTLTAAQLYLQCTYFHLDISLACRNGGILRAYASASRLVDMAMSDTESTNTLRYSPRTTVRMLNIAAAVIFRVLYSSLRSEVNYDTGKVLFNAACLCMGQQALRSRDHDMPVRWASFLHKMWDRGVKDEKLLQSPPTLQIKGRGGTSILYDCLKMFRQPSKMSQDAQVRELAASEAINQNNDQNNALALDWEGSDLFDLLWTDELCDSDVLDIL